MSTRPRVVVYDSLVPFDWSYALDAEIVTAGGAELVVPESVAADVELRSADVLIATGLQTVDAAVIARLERCVGILCYSIGMNQVDAEAAARAGIPVRNVAGYCTDEVSDHALALLLAAERRIVPFATAAAAGEWGIRDRPELRALRRLRGRTLGVLGAGRIGREVARKARAFGYRTIAFDPMLAAAPEPDLELVSLEELAAAADAIVCCAALTPASRGLVSRDVLGRVRPGLVFVNVARGALVDEVALLEALDAGRVAVAALDVREPEPPPADDRLGRHPAVVMTPHVAAASVDAERDLHEQAARGALALLAEAGRLPVSVPVTS